MAPCSFAVAASAPGKLILFGEHAVVYHQPAICAALTDLRITVWCGETWDGFLHIEMPNLVPPIQGFRAKIMDFHIPEALVNKSYNDDEDSTALVAIQELIHQKLLHYKQDDVGITTLHDLAIQAMSPVIYLLNAIVPEIFLVPHRGMHIRVQSSSLPVGAGLGSSAALSVAMSAAFYKLSLLHHQQQQGDRGEGVDQTDPKQQKDATTLLLGRPSETALQKINDFAYQAERMNHGTPSGLDNTVSCYGGILYFIKNTMTSSTTTANSNSDNNNNSSSSKDHHPKQRPSFTIEHLDCSPPLKILLTNTMIPRSTKKLVETVRNMNNDFPDILHGILNSCGAITKTFYRMVTTNKNTTNTSNNDDATTHEEPPKAFNHSSVASLIDTNQCLLQAMRVSHPSIERICHIAKYKYGLSTKLTGAGGGGCVFTYLGDLAADNASTTTQSIVQELQMEGFQCMESTVGGTGVLWVEPTIMGTNFNGS